MSRPAKVAKMGGAWRGEAALATACARRRRAHPTTDGSGQCTETRPPPPPPRTGEGREPRAIAMAIAIAMRTRATVHGATMEGRRRSDGARPTEARGNGEVLPRDGHRAGWKWRATRDGYLGGDRVTVILAGTAES